jgi:hypothetical protein
LIFRSQKCFGWWRHDNLAWAELCSFHSHDVHLVRVDHQNRLPGSAVRHDAEGLFISNSSHSQSQLLNPQEMRPKEIKTIEELIENNFTFYDFQGWFNDIKEMEFIKRVRLVFISYEEAINFYEKLTQGSNRALIATCIGNINELSSDNYTVLDEKVITEQFGYDFPMNHFVLDTMNHKVVQLVESGIIETLIKQPSKPDSNDEQTVLQFSHLSIWFYFGMALLLISMFVFFVEILVGKVLKFRKKF